MNRETDPCRGVCVCRGRGLLKCVRRRKAIADADALRRGCVLLSTLIIHHHKEKETSHCLPDPRPVRAHQFAVRGDAVDVHGASGAVTHRI